MLKLLSDNDVLGHVKCLAEICQSTPWDEFWHDLGCIVCKFGEVGLPANAPDSDVWQACQANEMVLITANRNADDPTSLEVTIRKRNQTHCLPVLTLSDADRVLHDRQYAEAVARRLLEILLEIDLYRGTGRLFLP